MNDYKTAYNLTACSQMIFYNLKKYITINAKVQISVQEAQKCMVKDLQQAERQKRNTLVVANYPGHKRLRIFFTGSRNMWIGSRTPCRTGLGKGSVTSSPAAEMCPGIQRMAFQSVRHATVFVSLNIITDMGKNMVPLFLLECLLIWLLNGVDFSDLMVCIQIQPQYDICE